MNPVNKMQMNRRDFLKLLGLASLTGLGVQGLTADLQGSERDMGFPNIIIVVFDALSAKHISTYGYHRETTPNLSRFAERATVFHRHYSAGNFTMPGTSSLLTGTYPWSHGGYHLFGTIRDAFQEKSIFSLFSDEYFTSTFTRNPIVRGLINQFGDDVHQFPGVEEHSIFSATLTNIFFENDPNVSSWSEMNLRGYSQEKAASPFISSVINRWVNGRVLEETRKLKEQFPRDLPTNANGQHFILEHAIDWMVSAFASGPKPFFGYFHLFPPHSPYRTRREFDGLFDDGWQPTPKPPHFFTEGHTEEFLAEERRYYDEFIAYADAEFGRFVAGLEQRGLLDHTFLIFTSDHGEMFERGIYKHLTPTLYEPLIHIPLVIRAPQQMQRKDVFSFTSCVDMVPTLLNITGKPIPEWCEGQILPIADLNASQDADRGIFALEAKSNAQRGPLAKFTIAYLQGPYKLIHYRGYDGYENEYELYNLENDPEELINIYESSPEIAAELRDVIDQKISEANQNMH